MKITLRMLADELGVTVPAVSMALRNHPRISLELRARAKALAKRRGYIPNPAFSRSGAVREARSRPTMPLALVVQRHPTGDHTLLNYFSTIRRVAERFGYQLQVHLCEADEEHRVGAVLFARGVEAVLVGPVFYPAFIRRFPWGRFSAVALNPGHYRPPCHLVMPDVAQATFNAVRRALKASYRRVGLYDFTEPVDPVDWADRFGAAAAAGEICRSWGAEFFHGEGEPFDEAAFAAWVRRCQPDVVLGQTAACVWWLRNLAGAARPLPSFTIQMDPSERGQGIRGFVHDIDALATVAVKLLDTQVRNFERGRPSALTRQLVSLRWHNGSPPRRAASASGTPREGGE